MEKVTKNADRANDLGTENATDTDVDTNTSTNRADNPSSDTEGAIGSDDNGNSKTRCPKIVSFSINNIISYGYSMQLITKTIKLKNLLRFK